MNKDYTQHVVVQSLSRVRFFATPWTTAHQASLSVTNSQNLLKLMSIESVMPSNHLVVCHPPLLAGVKGQMKTSLSTTGNQRMENGFRSKLKVFLSPRSHEKWSWCFDEGGGGAELVPLIQDTSLEGCIRDSTVHGGGTCTESPTPQSLPKRPDPLVPRASGLTLGHDSLLSLHS